MIWNYSILAWRNIRRRSFYSILNLISLVTGILFTLLIGAYAWTELRVNKNLRHAKNQYFLQSDWKDQNEGMSLTTFGPLAKVLADEYPHLVANYYRGDFVTTIISRGDKHFREMVDIGDSTLLTMYGFKLLHGQARTAMNNPFSVVVRKDIAIKYFGKADVVGQTITIQNFSYENHDFVITGVLDDIPENSVTDLNIDNQHRLFIPASTAGYFQRLDRSDWNNLYFPSYIELKDGASLSAVQSAIDTLVKKHAHPSLASGVTVRPVPLSDYYLEKDNMLIKRLLTALCLVGAFILVMAIVNFVNISISSSTSRIREIGVRKVFGGTRKHIILQFLIEAVIFASLATIIATAAYPLARPLFESMVAKDIPSLNSFPAWYVSIPFTLALAVGIVAGLYPAFVFSSMKSVNSVTGKLATVREKIWLRKLLAGFQFCLATAVMISAFIVTRQVAYFFGRNLGYNKQYVVSSQMPRNWSAEGVKKMETIRNEFAKMPGIVSASISYEIPDGMNGGQATLYRADQDSTRDVGFQAMACDQYFFRTYEISIRAGRFFDESDASDPNKVVLNEAAARALGWYDPREAIGKQVRFPGYEPVCTVIGITADYHFFSMQKKIPPMVFNHIRLFNAYRYISFRLKPGNTAAEINAIEKKWAMLLPGSSFEYRFMDETLERLYQSELQLKRASFAASGLSLLVVLLGIIGMVSLSIQKRTREIGIRKVLGASVYSITMLFLKDFLWVAMVAGLIACPVAWITMTAWLNNYAYRIEPGPWPFIVSLSISSILTVLLISFQTIKAGNSSTVNSLKAE